MIMEDIIRPSLQYVALEAFPLFLDFSFVMLAFGVYRLLQERLCSLSFDGKNWKKAETGRGSE